MPTHQERLTIETINEICKNTLISNLGIEFIFADDTTVKAKMPVDQRTIQPMKILHGGANMALAETVGSAGSFLLIDRETQRVVGLEINGNHVASAKEGFVTATGKIVHKGSRTHVWTVEIHDQNNKLISTCRITNMILSINE